MTPRPSHLAEQFDDALQQRDASTLGMWAFLATEILFFGVLFAGYTVMRLLWGDAFAAASRHTDPWLGAIETGILLVSSFTMVMAIRAVQIARPRAALLLLLVTALLGVAFLAVHGLEYVDDYRAGVIPGVRYDEPGVTGVHEKLFFLLYYVTTLFHGLHVFIGVVLVTVMAVRVRRGALSPRYYTPLEVVGLYWHLVDIVWIFVFPLYYQVGRS
ncbi:cytochrome c oxidase subunit 3 family protein [Luteibacter sp.]|uniref:cytochrome c oxidase subunit 3 family protein n=1 Tax=Luteibacter sp. TaxID=1886636 RepID=UPI003F8009BD